MFLFLFFFPLSGAQGGGQKPGCLRNTKQNPTKVISAESSAKCTCGWCGHSGFSLLVLQCLFLAHSMCLVPHAPVSVLPHPSVSTTLRGLFRGSTSLDVQAAFRGAKGTQSSASLLPHSAVWTRAERQWKSVNSDREERAGDGQRSLSNLA